MFVKPSISRLTTTNRSRSRNRGRGRGRRRRDARRKPSVHRLSLLATALVGLALMGAGIALRIRERRES
jgi:hypothetical protein